MVNVGIIGASGYTGLELIKTLLAHPHFKINYLSVSEEGQTLSSLHPSLEKVLDFNVEKADVNIAAQKCELIFLALPHKTAVEFAKALLAKGVRVIDLSADYRLKKETYEAHYCIHEDEENLRHAVYGLPEFFADKIVNAKLVANPGCYPSASILGIAPFLPFLDENSPVFIDAKSGVSGAGKKCTKNTHYVTINENIFAYSPLSHRHEPEITEKLEIIGNRKIDLNFVPHLLPITRGMLISGYLRLKDDIDEETIKPLKILNDFYQNSPFIRIRNEPVDVKSNCGTNFCDIFAARKGKNLFVSSSIDNLSRGASTQAVVNANIMYGFSQDAGINKIAYVP